MTTSSSATFSTSSSSSATRVSGAVLRALEGRGFLQSLAEPNLIAYNGQEASFLAGGEIPVPTVSGNSGRFR